MKNILLYITILSIFQLNFAEQGQRQKEQQIQEQEETNNGVEQKERSRISQETANEVQTKQETKAPEEDICAVCGQPGCNWPERIKKG